MRKNIVLFFIVSLCICTFVNCNNTDYTKEEKYLEEGRTRIFPWLTSTDPHDCISKGKTSHPYILQTL